MIEMAAKMMMRRTKMTTTMVSQTQSIRVLVVQRTGLQTSIPILMVMDAKMDLKMRMMMETESQTFSILVQIRSVK